MSQQTENPKGAAGASKFPMSAVPAGVLAELSVALLEGALKYGRHNYRAGGATASVYYDATLRHLMLWWEGEDMDPDTGGQLSHITKAIASLTVLRDAMLHQTFKDDRPPAQPIPSQHLQQLCHSLRQLHADKAPKHFTNVNIQPCNTKP